MAKNTKTKQTFEPGSNTAAERKQMDKENEAARAKERADEEKRVAELAQ